MNDLDHAFCCCHDLNHVFCWGYCQDRLHSTQSHTPFIPFHPVLKYIIMLTVELRLLEIDLNLTPSPIITKQRSKIWNRTVKLACTVPKSHCIGSSLSDLQSRRKCGATLHFGLTQNNALSFVQHREIRIYASSCEFCHSHHHMERASAVRRAHFSPWRGIPSAYRRESSPHILVYVSEPQCYFFPQSTWNHLTRECAWIEDEIQIIHECWLHPSKI